ncbi:hypothetical protein EON80_26930 [bacterium]|nr:MAG: hypothetical protein EON80_26930 [bacterium]
MKFRLQDYFVRDWAENLMFVLDVDDANAWYERARLVLADGTFPQARVKPPEAIDDALVTHLWDPSGVLLVIVAPRTRA